jgi:hypothetical protein
MWPDTKALAQLLALLSNLDGKLCNKKENQVY